MLTLESLVQHLHAYLNVALWEKVDFCPNGLQLEGKKELTSLAFAVSASLATIEKAVEAQVDALIVHHGLFWNKDPYPIIGTKKQKLQLLLDHGISLLGYHLPLDAHEEAGNNWRAARDLGLKELTPFVAGGSPIGVSGQCSPTSLEKWKEKLESYYSHPALIAPGGPEKIERVSLLSGGGWRYIEEAHEQGSHLYITGNHDEPAWHLALEKGIHFASLGHSNTETVGPQALMEYVGQTFSIPTQFLHVPNPF